MTCADVELSLLALPDPLPSEVEAHLAGCAACRAAFAETKTALELAALPEPTPAEEQALAGLEASTWAAWQAQAPGPRRSWSSGALRLALAAAVGAVVAASGVLVLRPPRVVEVVREARVEVPVAADGFAAPDWGQDEPLNLSDDAVFEEVSWPELTEGENP